MQNIHADNGFSLSKTGSHLASKIKLINTRKISVS